MDKDYYKKYEPIFGSWRITRLIGQGSFGRVYEIQREDFGVTYKAALKAITVPTSQAEVQEIMAEGMDEGSVRTYFGSFVKELVQEFALMSKLKGNSNVVSYENHQVIEHKDTIGWDILIQMELLTPLNAYIKEHKNISRQEVIRLGIDLCKALELCQKHNIIHRDIKPENIFVSDNGDFKLGDFGIARTVEKTSSGLSKKGTYSYMAPEVYKGEAYGSTVDIYSLGIVLYRLLNGNRIPFYPAAPAPITYADRENALAKRISGAPLPFPSHADGRLAEIVLKACEYDPKQRYSSPVQMRQELEAILYNRAESQIIYPEGDDIPQDSRGYIKDGDLPVEERELTFKVDGEQEANDDIEKTISDLDETISDSGDTVSEIEETISDLDEDGGGFGKIPIDDDSDMICLESIKKVAAKKKKSLKGILIGLGAVVAVIFALFFYAVFIEEGTPVLYSAVADYGEPFAYSDLSGVTRGYYAEVLDVVAEEMGYVTYPDILALEELNAVVLQGNEYAPILADDCIVGVSFAEPMSSEVAESKIFSTDTFVFLTTQDNVSVGSITLKDESVVGLPNVRALVESSASIGVVKGTLESAVAEWDEYLGDYDKKVFYDSAVEALIDLWKEEIDCLLLHEKSAVTIQTLNPEFFVLCDAKFSYSHTFKVRREDTKLLEKINTAIDRTKGSSLLDIRNKYITQWGEYKEQIEFKQYQRDWAQGLNLTGTDVMMDHDKDTVWIGVLGTVDSREIFMFLADQNPTIEMNGQEHPIGVLFSEPLEDSDRPVQYWEKKAQEFVDYGCQIVIETDDLGYMEEDDLQSFSDVLKAANIPFLAVKERSEYNIDNFVEDHRYPIHYAVEYLKAELVLGYNYGGAEEVENLGAAYDTAGEYLRGESSVLYIDNDVLYIDSNTKVSTDYGKDGNIYNFWSHYGGVSPVVTTSKESYNKVKKNFWHDQLYYIVQAHYGEFLGEKDHDFIMEYKKWQEKYGINYINLYYPDEVYESYDLWHAALEMLKMEHDLYQNQEKTLFEGLTGTFYFAQGNLGRWIANYVSRTIEHYEEGFVLYTMEY